MTLLLSLRTLEKDFSSGNQRYFSILAFKVSAFVLYFFTSSGFPSFPAIFIMLMYSLNWKVLISAARIADRSLVSLVSAGLLSAPDWMAISQKNKPYFLSYWVFSL